MANNNYRERIQYLVNMLVDEIGEESLLEKLQKISGPESVENALTIICDETMHSIPKSIVIGDQFVFSSGSLNLETSATLHDDLVKRVVRLTEFLKNNSYEKVRIVFSGHSVFPAIVKMVVYRTIHVETEDVLYFGSRGYMEVRLNMREIVEQSRIGDLES